jgi:WNK lysine deficient protein kinase
MSESTNSCVTVTRGEKIGRGSFKDVYVALNTEGNAEAAWCELVINPDNEKKVSIELKVLKDLRHPNILQLCHYQIFDNSEGKVMVLLTEFMFKDLKCYIKDNQPHISKWGCQILMGLQYLHEQSPSVIHRDLKCENLFVYEKGNLVKIGDFGLATFEEWEDKTKTVVGTVAYRAPEVFKGRYDQSVDIYSFGLCLLEMYTIEAPYRECGQDSEQVRNKIIEHVLPLTLEKVNDKGLQDIIIDCLKLDPTERPTAEELLKADYFKLE